MPEQDTPMEVEEAPVETTQEPEPNSTEKQDDPTDLPADHPLVKALAAQKATIKELKTKAARLDEIEEAQKTELQKAVERAEAAEGVAYALQAAEQVRGWKAQVSKKTGVPVDVLRGSDLEEIEEHAASLKALLPAPRKPGQVPGEGQTVTSGTGDRREQFANIIRNAHQ